MMKGSLYSDHFFATICVFSGIYLASYLLAMSAVNASTNDPGLVLLTFQDALSLIEQVGFFISRFLFLCGPAYVFILLF